MAKINSLRDIIQFNSNFKTAINLYLSLNKAEKVLGYIPTKSSVSFLGEYLKAVLENKEQATLLVGPYGKGKSHLLLVLLAVLSMKKTPESESAIQLVIDEINRYIDSCCDKKVSVKGMVYKLVKAPYGMRAGVIPFYLAYVLANRREDIIVYFSNKEVQITSDIVVNMCEQPEDYAVYVSKEDLQKEKYISELNMLFEVDDNWNLSSNRIKDIIICMQRWFRSLQQATRNVIYLDQYVDNDNMVQAMKTMKKAMQKVEFNPFEILFVEFPEAFGTESLEETFNVIDDCKTRYDDYFRWIEEQAIKAIYDLWDKKRKQNLYHTLKEWYDKQGKRSKMGLYDGRMTNFMSCLEGMDVYSDQDVASKVVKAVTDVYMENWNTGSLEEFVEALTSVKNEVESIRDDSVSGELELKFIGRNGETIKKLYSYADENTGSILRNVIEDTLDEYDDLSVNDRVSILLEMIEKIIK